jgi:hypothetical protein
MEKGVVVGVGVIVGVRVGVMVEVLVGNGVIVGPSSSPGAQEVSRISTGKNQWDDRFMNLLYSRIKNYLKRCYLLQID